MGDIALACGEQGGHDRGRDAHLDEDADAESPEIGTKTDDQKNKEMIANANNSYITKKEQENLKKVVESKGYKVEDIFNKPLSELTGEEYVKALTTLNGAK